MMPSFKPLIILSLIIHNGIFITLDGSWTGIIKYCGESTNDNCTKDVRFPATVPGGIYSDLSNANLIPINLYGMNDVNNRWVGNQSVIYFTKFEVNETMLQAPKTVLIFHGLDTVATIFLNNHEVGKSSNMFLRYTFDVSKNLKKGRNILKVVFLSSVKVSEEIFNKQKLQYVVPPVCVPKEYNGECHVNHIRKMQASFSWDWGPAFPSMGIWKSVELVAINEIKIIEVTTDIHRRTNNWEIALNIFLDTALHNHEKDVPCHITSLLHINEKADIHNSSTILLKSNNNYLVVSTLLKVPLDAVKMWWPNGYGDQNLYKVTVIISTSNSVTRKDIRVGFRVVELVQEPLEKGLSFYFRINGVPIFAKGSNLIPFSVFPELSSKEESIRHLLLSTKETHMNMLRVWGGGVYESELFYNLADEYGIMIWQDFMFACSMYPVTDGFIRSVKEEVLQNVRRLKNHPSIVIWAGNNENEAALYGNWYGTGTAQVYRDDYVKLYVNVIMKEVEQLDSTRPYVVSSPGNGALEKSYNYTGVNPYSNLYGDVHYYNYLKNGWDANQYPRTRFSSEYGFQSLPSIYTFAPIIETIDDLRVNSDFLRHRQHLPFGMVFLNNLISRNFRIPKSNNTVADFIHYIYLSQINQAVSQKIQTEFYRQAKSELNSVGEGMTMGALYWQLNDVWQAPSWSSIDIEGRWKMLHYYALEFFAPIIVTSHLSAANDLSIYVVSDKLYSVQKATVDMIVHKWSQNAPIRTKSYKNILIEANKAKKIASVYLNEFLSKAGCGSLANAKKQCIIKLTLKDRDGSLIAPINYVYPTVIKDVNLPISTTLIRVGNLYLPGKYTNYPDFEIVLTTDKITLFVWLETGNIRGRFSENGFHMFERTKRIVFHAYEAVTSNILRMNIRITTLSDIYNPNKQKDQVDDIIDILKV